MDYVPPIHRLSNELLKHILDQIEPDPERTVPIDDRRFISVESLEIPPPSSDSIRDIGRFRETCRRFAEVGAPLLFTLVKVRFSEDGLDKLETFAGWSHLARHVKKFSYLMPYFYSNEEDLRAVVSRNGTIRANVTSLQRKASEQQKIIRSGDDVRILKKAFSSFKTLQFVKLLPVAEEEDRRFREYVQIHGSVRDFINHYWAPAIIHGSRTIGAALLAADAPWSRLYLPVESVESVEFLALRTQPTLSILAARLTCLTLVFDEGNDLGEDMTELSELFKTVFTSAKNMQAVHIGFPRSRPVSLPLEAVFHNVTWDKLVALGVAGWDLTAEEIINLALRHREKLKGLRLRDVHLKEGGMWKDVLRSLKHSMPRLQWVSLRRIGYVPQFEESDPGGAEVPEDQPWALSDSDSESEDDEDSTIAGPSEQGHYTNGYHTNSNSFTTSNGHVHDHDHDDIDSAVGTDDEHEPEDNATEFPNLDSPTSATAPLFAYEMAHNPDLPNGDIDDDGFSVSNAKRKLWEQWVVGQTSRHVAR
ncbi:uncharacterized protein LTR77_003383 [Saxophila tyrrhenica]|uniref:F-box domain-containing protein n=1 Tax=Saxophila tyrrhenica TaxID=1690608 RepID=A0AAV9PHH3_9PEZI|nr:hypothetical protein LTR77_003383 [Saxophila tyrrhenica]